MFNVLNLSMTTQPVIDCRDNESSRLKLLWSLSTLHLCAQLSFLLVMMSIPVCLDADSDYAFAMDADLALKTATTSHTGPTFTHGSSRCRWCRSCVPWKRVKSEYVALENCTYPMERATYRRKYRMEIEVISLAMLNLRFCYFDRRQTSLSYGTHVQKGILRRTA